MTNQTIASHLALGAVIFAAVSIALPRLPAAHEAHKMACNQTAMNAMHADAQSMPDGDAKTRAMEEMKAAKEMMAKKDLEACGVHMQNATQAIEE